MRRMFPVISNTSPLSNLAVIGHLRLVKEQFREVIIPAAVWEELQALPHLSGAEELCAANREGWINVVTVQDEGLVDSLRLFGLDRGESEAIALAYHQRPRRLLIDEKKGRIAARKFGIPVTGALGVLATAFRQGSIFSAREEIMRLKTEAGFFVSDEVVDHILEIAGER